MSFLTDPDRLEPSYKDTYEKWKTSPTPQTTGALLTAIQPDINKGITAHVGKQVSPMTRSRARRMALQAIQSYDPTKAKLGTHVINQLQGLRRVVRRQTQVLRTPERVAIDQNRVRLAKQELLDETGRDPSMAELAVPHRSVHQVGFSTFASSSTQQPRVRSPACQVRRARSPSCPPFSARASQTRGSR